jgi:hypothetical protein
MDKPGRTTAPLARPRGIGTLPRVTTEGRAQAAGKAATVLAMTGALALTGLLSGCKATTTGSPGSSGSPPWGSSGGDTAPAVSGSALAAAEGLTVKGRAPKTGYSRDQFGEGWTDTDHNGCDTRDDVLHRDLTDETFRADEGGDCVVTSGVLKDPYTGETIRFTRGHSTVDIDHVVALSDAWQKGARYWSRDKRVRLANDPLNLLAVDAPANRGKGDGDTATWIPPNTAFRCPYVARQVAVKRKYGLWVTSAEKSAMEKVLDTCPQQKLPTSGKPVVAGSGSGGGSGSGSGGGSGTSPAAPANPTPTRTPTATSYANCAAVRKAGAAPLHKGEPGYSRSLDRDGDGIACDT